MDNGVFSPASTTSRRLRSSSIAVSKEPTSGFVRYSASRLVDTGFSKRIDEHGSIYVKVVKLKEKHPLVEFK